MDCFENLHVCRENYREGWKRGDFEIKNVYPTFLPFFTFWTTLYSYNFFLFELKSVICTFRNGQVLLEDWKKVFSFYCGKLLVKN